MRTPKQQLLATACCISSVSETELYPAQAALGNAFHSTALPSPCGEKRGDESYLKVPAGFDPPQNETDAGSPLTRKKCTPLPSALDTEGTLQASNRQPQPPAGLKSEPKQPKGRRENRFDPTPTPVPPGRT
jgi:hypothetical protein